MHVWTILALGGLVAAAGLLSAADDKDDAIKKELKRIEGTWEVVSMEQNGQQLPLPDKKMLATFMGNKYVMKIGDQVVQEGEGKIDPTQQPRTLDVKVTSGDDKGQSMLGIYELKSDQIRACVAAPGKKRPTKFTSKNDQMLITYKRVKS
jgi:uncharacterized protein (TIGR03067 family)